MTAEEYTAWAKDHVVTFGLSAEHLPMFLSWFAPFSAAGFTADDLAAATRLMVTNPPFPKWPGDHLAAVNGHVRDAQRARQAARIAGGGQPGDFRGQCVLCADSGWVVVPHPKAIEGGKWVTWLALAVACHCWRGSETSKGHQPSNKGPFKRPATMAEYQKLVPGWRDLIQVREDSAALMANAKADSGPKTGREIVLRLAESLKFATGRKSA